MSAASTNSEQASPGNSHIHHLPASTAGERAAFVRRLNDAEAAQITYEGFMQSMPE